jgi:hypothetical protein
MNTVAPTNITTRMPVGDCGPNCLVDCEMCSWYELLPVASLLLVLLCQTYHFRRKRQVLPLAGLVRCVPRENEVESSVTSQSITGYFSR